MCPGVELAAAGGGCGAQLLAGALIAAWGVAGAEPGAAADSVTTSVASADSVAVLPEAGADSVAVFPEAGADSVAGLPEAGADSVAGLPEAGADSVAVFPEAGVAVAALPDTAAAVVVLPDTALSGPPVLGQPLAETRVDRDETERTGAHTPFQLVGLLPAHRAVEVCGTTAVGALATRGSFGAAQLEVDGWTVRLPRLEGRDLAALSLDRLGPHAGLSSYASLGSLRASSRPRRCAPHRQAIALRTVEPASQSGARSRVAVYTGDFDFTGGGVTLFDRRGRLDYQLGVMNGSAGRSGALESMSTRLAMIDLGWLAGHGRWSLGTRNGERNLTWKSTAGWRQFDQTARLGYAHRDSTGGPEWSLHLTGLDDRLSGSEFPAVEFRRRGLKLDGTLVAQRSRQPLWARVRLGRDWFSLRSVSETLAPRVERGTLELGTTPGLGQAGTLSGSGSLRASA